MKFKIFSVLFFSLLILSCSYDKEENLFPNNNCDTTNVAYSKDISSYLNRLCVGCHNAAAPSAGIVLDTYTEVKKYADNGRLLGSVRHDDGFKAMPQSMPKSPKCDIDKLEAWIADGAPNN